MAFDLKWTPLLGKGTSIYDIRSKQATIFPSVTFGRQTVTAGAVYLDPFGIKGEIGTGLIWFEPRDLVPGFELRNQTGFEAYWKILLTPNLWITPGFQFLWNSSLNPTEDRVFIPHIKFRLAY